MAYYRVYSINAADEIKAGEHIEAATDEDAIEQAAVMAGDFPIIEIWTGTRVVGRFTRQELKNRVTGFGGSC
jgi:hypothetical protein